MKSDKEKFVALMKANMKRAYYSALVITGSHDEAMELSQMAFIRAYKNFDSFDTERNFYTWYYKILRNLCLNKIRDTKRKNEVSIFECIEMETEEENATEKTEREELTQNVRKALMKLNADDREIIMMNEFEGLTYKEIAGLLDIPTGSVMSRLFYARKKLGKLLNEELR